MNHREHREHGENLSGDLTESIIGAAIEVHKTLGPGLLETAYESCLCHELLIREILFERQRPVPLAYKGVELDCGFRIDLLVGNTVIVEIKSVEQLLPVHEAQLLTYMRLASSRVGLLINFNVKLLTKGIRRLVL